MVETLTDQIPNEIDVPAVKQIQKLEELARLDGREVGVQVEGRNFKLAAEAYEYAGSKTIVIGVWDDAGKPAGISECTIYGTEAEMGIKEFDIDLEGNEGVISDKFFELVNVPNDTDAFGVTEKYWGTGLSEVLFASTLAILESQGVNELTLADDTTVYDDQTAKKSRTLKQNSEGLLVPTPLSSFYSKYLTKNSITRYQDEEGVEYYTRVEPKLSSVQLDILRNSFN